MSDRLTGQARRDFFARYKVPEDRHLVKWWGLSLDEMTKAELRIVIDNCIEVMQEERKRMKEVIFVE